MKKIMALALLLAIVTPAQANEIPGTRVAGQGAVCAEGQGKALEINVTTKEEWSYCIEIIPPTPPTQQELEAKAQQQIAKTITERKNENAPTVVAEETITAEPTPITETLTKVEVNATTGVVTVSELTDAEKEEIAKNRAIWQAKENARIEARLLATQTQGTKQCVNWQAQGESGSECDFDPIPATEEEVTEQFEFLQDLFAFNWFDFLNLFVDWRW